MLVLWLGTSIQQAWQGENRPVFERLEVRSDGTLLIQSFPQDNLSEATYRDLKGVVQDAPDRNDLLPAVYLFGAPGDTGLLFPAGRAGRRGSRPLWMSESPPSTGSSCTTASRTERGTLPLTSARAIGGSVSLACPVFDQAPCRQPTGFPCAADRQSSAPVSIYSRQAWVLRPAAGDVPPRLVYLPSGNQLRQADLAARTVTTVFETPEPIESVGIPTLAYWSTGHSTTEQPILVRTTRQIHELDQQHHVKKVFSLPAEVDRRSRSSGIRSRAARQSPSSARCGRTGPTRQRLETVGLPDRRRWSDRGPVRG